MPQEMRVRAHNTTFLVTFPVANEKDTRFGNVKPPKVTICRVFKALRRSEFCSYYPCDIFIMDKSRLNAAKCGKSMPSKVVEK